VKIENVLVKSKRNSAKCKGSNTKDSISSMAIEDFEFKIADLGLAKLMGN
jgi:hypothetical protein